MPRSPTLNSDTVLGIVAFQRGFQSAHPVLHVPAVGDRPVWHREGRRRHGREAVVGEHEDRRIGGHLPEDATHVLPQDLPHRGVVDEGQVGVVVVEVLVGEVEDHHVDEVGHVAGRDAAFDVLILLLDLELHRQSQVDLEGVLFCLC